ncbi:MAG: hypothetical protein KKG06_00645 [Bacteroidetes bacterium]|nr:hypothetical protein [Bacteroidota bacterium]MBU1421687.1 hypothetical protein [Bacteroidota bacterium]
MKVVEIEDKSFDPVISFMIDNSNLMVYGKPYKGHIKGIALFDDLDKAKARWLGKTLYSKTRSILTYDAQADKYGEVKVQIGSALKVNDIWFGLHATEPLWLIVETPEGAKGAIPTAFSWTNFYSDWWKDTRPWEDKFYEFNPKEKFKWSLEIWQLINDGKVRIGMTKEQVRLAWGRPKKANEDIYQGSVREQWVYDSQYLYFENEKLTAMQNR